MRNFFDEIPGNSALRRRIGEEITAGNLSHAYIIEGGRGYGKKDLALAMVMALCCAHRTDEGHALPCGVCRSCRKIKEGLCPDVITVRRPEGKATMGVETVRTIREGLAVVPNDLEFKVYLIEEAHTMTVQAQNALLLTLEEPPPFVLFLLLTEDAGALLETVRSRAPVYRMQPLSRQDLHAYLQKESEAVSLARNDSDEYAQLLTLAAGSPGVARTLLDPRLRAPLIRQRQFAERVIICLADSRPAGELLLLLSERGNTRDDMIADLTALQTGLRDLTLASKSDRPPLLFFTDQNRAADLSARFTTTRLLDLSAAVAAAVDSLTLNANVRLVRARLLQRLLAR